MVLQVQGGKRRAKGDKAPLCSPSPQSTYDYLLSVTVPIKVVATENINEFQTKLHISTHALIIEFN